ncbi:hypothetical protein GYMLUDRAFT_919922 [Collybiopsis luxurians FD-317 M1]|uniref:Uncharacterized protein n=1 Tax=Collybiopsis luxurians FD-317 M1 TaxID=944289 RepID=A0A0D0BWK5_9AGAR|nr:hypothetical protein GYMLUDRAFT_919922 [Collybiopsis luxurians FD-317 M1]
MTSSTISRTLKPPMKRTGGMRRWTMMSPLTMYSYSIDPLPPPTPMPPHSHNTTHNSPKWTLVCRLHHR